MHQTSFVCLFILAFIASQTHNSQAQDGSRAASTSASDLSSNIAPRALERLKQSISAIAGSHPGLFDPVDLDNFLNDRTSISATRFLKQRSYNPRRASRLAQRALKWRRALGLSQLTTEQFPCDLFKLGLIFEEGRAHRRQTNGLYVESNPVIWIRMGALGAIIKQLERFSVARIGSFAYSMPRASLHKVSNAVRSVVQRFDRGRLTRRERRERRNQRALVNNLSVEENGTLQHVLKAIAWWLENWAKQNPDSKATLVFDFENTDFAFTSWSVGDFFMQLDDMFPDLFDKIIGFRFKSLWSAHSPVSKLVRFFKSRISSSPETDAKVIFSPNERQLSEFIPRVDTQGFTMLPEHVSGACMSPDNSKAPSGCKEDSTQSGGLYDPKLWQTINNEFYYSCRAKSRSLS